MKCGYVRVACLVRQILIGLHGMFHAEITQLEPSEMSAETPVFPWFLDNE
jgi:hypothetical protein